MKNRSQFGSMVFRWATNGIYIAPRLALSGAGPWLGVQVPRVGLLKWIESRSVGVLPQPYIPGVPSKGDKMHRQGGYITFFVLFSHF